MSTLHDHPNNATTNRSHRLPRMPRTHLPTPTQKGINMTVYATREGTTHTLTFEASHERRTTCGQVITGPCTYIGLTPTDTMCPDCDTTDP